VNACVGKRDGEKSRRETKRGQKGPEGRLTGHALGGGVREQGRAKRRREAHATVAKSVTVAKNEARANGPQASGAALPRVLE